MTLTIRPMDRAGRYPGLFYEVLRAMRYLGRISDEPKEKPDDAKKVIITWLAMETQMPPCFVWVVSPRSTAIFYMVDDGQYMHWCGRAFRGLYIYDGSVGMLENPLRVATAEEAVEFLEERGVEWAR